MNQKSIALCKYFIKFFTKVYPEIREVFLIGINIKSIVPEVDPGASTVIVPDSSIETNT